MSLLSPFVRHRRLGARAVLLAVVAVVLACVASPAYADTATLAAGDASASPGLGQQLFFNIPVTRGAAQTYDTAVGYHAIDNGAIAGADYEPLPGTVLVPAGATSVDIPVTVRPGLRDGGPLTFQLQIDNATGIGPAPAFAGHVDASAGASTVPYAIASADLNGDGKPDIVTTNAVVAGGVSVLLSTTPPGGTPAFAAAVVFATGPAPQGVAIGDIDGDGKPDLVVANYGSNNVSILLNTTALGTATPTFATQQTFVTGAGNPHAVAIADVNGDGKPDLIVTNKTGNQVSVLLNTTAQSPTVLGFTPWQGFATGVNPQGVAMCDFNGDGLADIVVANQDDTLSVLLNTTTPGATTPSFAAQQTFAAGTLPTGVRCADLNGDGRPDLIVAYATGTQVSVLLNVTQPGDVSPRFAAHQEFDVGNLPGFIAVGDLNLDGKPDLISADFLDNAVSVLLNTTAPGAAAPSFASYQSFGTGAGSGPQGIAVSDVDVDGWPDIVVADGGNAGISVLRNTTAPAPAPAAFALQPALPNGSQPIVINTADVNGDGRRDLIFDDLGGRAALVQLNTTPPGATAPTFAAPVIVPGAHADQDLTVADFNGDGRPDLVMISSLDGAVDVMLNTTSPGAATPSFAAPQSFPSGSGIYTLTTADINGDGLPDVITHGSNVTVLLNTSQPGSSTLTFSGFSFAGGSASVWTESMIAADINGDGRPDLALANAGDSTFSVLLNTTTPGASTPTFAARQTFGTPAASLIVAAADINADDRLDLIGSNGGPKTAVVLLNTTAAGASVASFAAAQSFPAGDISLSIAIVDINGDGKPDLAVAGRNIPAISALINTTMPGAVAATFAPYQTFALAASPISAASDDVNRDGKPDLIVANPNAGSLSVLLNSQLFIPFSATAATASITPERIFASGNEVLPVQCSGTSTYADFLIEDFPGSTLDVSRWTAHANAGSVNVANNAVKLASSGSQFPFVTSAGSPIPATGDFSVRWNVTYDSVSDRGDGALVIARGLPANGVAGSDAGNRASAWQDSTSGFFVSDRADTGAVGNVFSTPASSSATHDVEYCWLSSSIEIWVDGALVTQQARDPALARPDALWMGNPVDVGSNGTWNDFTLHSVHVRSISP